MFAIRLDMGHMIVKFIARFLPGLAIILRGDIVVRLSKGRPIYENRR